MDSGTLKAFLWCAFGSAFFFALGVSIGNCYNYYKAHPTEIPVISL